MALDISQISLSQAEHSETEDEEGPVLTDGDQTSATDADLTSATDIEERVGRRSSGNRSSGTRTPRVSFMPESDQERDDVRRRLIEKANTIEVAENGRLGWQADGTPSNAAAPGEGEQDIRAAVQQLAQRYNGPREFWTESTLPTITKDSLPSQWMATKDSLPSAWATRDQLPAMTMDSLPSNWATRDQLPVLTREALDDAHPSSPSSDDGKGCLSLESESDNSHHFPMRHHRTRTKRLLSQETLPTIISESCENSEIGSQHNGSMAGSLMGSRMGSRPVSRCHTRDSLPDLDAHQSAHQSLQNFLKARTTTKDSLPPIGDDSESEESSVDGDANQEDRTPSARTNNESSEGDAGLKSPVDKQEALRLAYEQISAMRKQADSLRQKNSSLAHENSSLKKIAGNGELLRSFAGVANNPKHLQTDQSCLERCRKGEDVIPWQHRRLSDPGPQSEQKLQQVTPPPEPPEPPEEGEAPVSITRSSGSALDESAVPTLTSKELWLQRRQDRRERRMSATEGKISYRRWLQEQHEQAPVLASANNEELPRCPMEA